MRWDEMVEKKDLKAKFRDFLINLETFLESSALKIAEDLAVFVLYLQEPEEREDEIYAWGLVQIGSYRSPLKVTYIIDLNDIEIKSKFFEYHISFEEMKEFLAQIHGGAEE
jgi:hypothetical protein